MQLKCSVTFCLRHLLFGNNLLTSLWLRHRALSFGPHGAGRTVPVRLTPLLPPCCCSQLTTVASASLPSASVPLLTSGIPPARKGLPPLVCQADSLQPNQLMEQLSAKLFNCSSSSDTTSAAQLTFMRHFLSVNSLSLSNTENHFLQGRGEKEVQRHCFPFEQVSTHRCSVNKWRINEVILQQVDCLPGRSQEFHNVIHLLTSSGPRMSRLRGGLSYKNHHQVL